MAPYHGASEIRHMLTLLRPKTRTFNGLAPIAPSAPGPTSRPRNRPLCGKSGQAAPPRLSGPFRPDVIAGSTSPHRSRSRQTLGDTLRPLMKNCPQDGRCRSDLRGPPIFDSPEVGTHAVSSRSGDKSRVGGRCKPMRLASRRTARESHRLPRRAGINMSLERFPHDHTGCLQ